MERMGHSSPRALIYQHATRERDHKIAAGMGKLFADAKKPSTKTTGTKPKRSQARNGARSPSAHPERPAKLIGKAPVTSAGSRRADDGNRTRMTSLEGVLRMAVRAAELGGSLSRGDRG